MTEKFDVDQYWLDVLRQDADTLRTYFASGACINWHNTDENFTAEEFIFANCAYPGSWEGEIEKRIYLEDCVITVVRVYDTAHNVSFHVTSFIYLADNQIHKIDEYWGDDGEPPAWRKKMQIGRKIQ